MGVKAAIVGALLMATPSVHADTDTLIPLTFASFPTDLKKALVKFSLRDSLTPLGCLEGGNDKRTVCTFKLGAFMSIMAESRKGEKDIVAVTMICASQSPSELLKCPLAYAALMTAADPQLTADQRGKIFQYLMDGIALGTEASLRMEERKYLLQKSVGLWFHVIAADGED